MEINLTCWWGWHQCQRGRLLALMSTRSWSWSYLSSACVMDVWLGGPIGWLWCIDIDIIVLALMSAPEVMHLCQPHDDVFWWNMVCVSMCWHWWSSMVTWSWRSWYLLACALMDMSWWIVDVVIGRGGCYKMMTRSTCDRCGSWHNSWVVN